MTSLDNQSSSDNSDNNISPIENPSPLVSNSSEATAGNGIIHVPATGEDSDKLNALQKYGEESHLYIREYIRSADQKAAFFFATFSALLAYLNSSGYLTVWVSNPTSWRLTEVLSFFATVGFLVSAFCCLFVVIPRLSGSRRGLVFFNAIIEYPTQQDFVTDVMETSPNKLNEEKIKHVYDIAKVCNRKYKVLRLGLWSGGVGFCGMALLLLTI